MLLRKEVSDGYSRDSQIPLKLHFPHYIAFVKILTYFIFIVINNNDFFFFFNKHNQNISYKYTEKARCNGSYL